MMRIKWYCIAQAVTVLPFVALLGTAAAAAQQPDSSTVIRAVDAAVMARIAGMLDTPSPSTMPSTETTTKPVQWLK